MSENTPVACSLGERNLELRLADIAAIGAGSLIDHNHDGNRHVLRFHRNPLTRARLTEIIAAEAQCCSFLDLSLNEFNEELVLSIAAPASGQAAADGLASAFAAKAP